MLAGDLRENLPYRRRLLGRDDHLDSGHAVFEIALRDLTAFRVVVRAAIRAALNHRVLLADLLELAPRAMRGVLEEQALVRRCCHARHRADLAIRHLAFAQCFIDRREIRQGVRYADVLASAVTGPAQPPRQPMRAGRRPLPSPRTRLIEGAQVAEESMRCSIEMSALLGDLFAQRFCLFPGERDCGRRLRARVRGARLDDARCLDGVDRLREIH